LELGLNVLRTELFLAFGWRLAFESIVVM